MRNRLMEFAVMAAIVAAGVACSSNQSNTTSAPPAATAAAHAAPVVGATIGSAAFTQDADGARIVLNADSPLLYTSYEPNPNLLIIDIPSTHTAPSFAVPSVNGTLVSSLKVEPMNELGKEQTRITIMHQPGLKYDISSQGKALAIAFNPSEETAAATPATPQAVAPALASPATPAVSPSPAPPVVTEEAARSLESLDVTGSVAGATVTLRGDGRLAPSYFTLQNPPRIVMDLSGVQMRVHRRVTPGAGPVLRARVSQFRSSPDRVARVVIDLDRSLPYHVEKNGEIVAIRVGEASPSPTAAVLPVEEVAPPAATTPAAPVSRTVIAASPSPAPPAAASPVAEPPAATSEPSTSVHASTLAKVATGPSVDAIEPDHRAHGVLEARRAPRSTASPAATATSSPSSSSNDALFESAEAMLDQPQNGGDSGTPVLNNTYKSRTVGGGETQYTGEPISLDLKDADIKDVFRTISQLTGLNIVIDPDVRGTVTVRLENVPWDQALELILKENGLGYILENNVMRIATTQKLQQEEQERAALAKARLESMPTRTVIRKLSYANAQEAAATIKKVMSPRGDVIVDARTNTLIIRELPDYLPTIMQLIENLDTPTPQVMIESRIVETTKTFGRTLGINWGFTGVSDVAHGNTTNLVFPNNGTVAGTVGLNAPAVNSLSLSLGNILNTFNLDAALQAGEEQGLVRIVSTPEVEAMTNEKAYIQTGLQIPVQTTVNNTTSVIYVDATLRMDVTPQITAEGTVLLDVKVTKRQPAPGVQIQGGGNVPLSIREAQTKLIVKDGGTAVIGGIFQMNDQDNYNYVPGLWKIPILGALFKNKTVSDQHDELLIFITPRIIH